MNNEETLKAEIERLKKRIEVLESGQQQHLLFVTIQNIRDRPPFRYNVGQQGQANALKKARKGEVIWKCDFEEGKMTKVYPKVYPKEDT